MKKIVLSLSIIILAAITLWYLSFPVLVVLSLIPGLETPPINLVSKEPQIQSTNLSFNNKTIPLDIYSTKKPRANLVILHAATELGKDDPRLIKIAQIFSRGNLKVFVPTLPSINRDIFHPDVIGEIKSVIKYARQDDPTKPLMVLGFSIGVGPELIAVSESEFNQEIDLVIAFGGYYDLKNVIRYHTTGFYEDQDKNLIQQRPPDPFGVWLFARYYSQFLPESDAKIFRELAERKFIDPEADVQDLAKKLDPKSMAAFQLLTNDDPEKVNELIEKLPANLKNFMSALDPKPHISKLEAPLLLLHSQQDIVIPLVESKKMLAALKQQNKKAELIELKAFDHINPVLPPVTIKSQLTIYIPELWQLYKVAFKILY